MAKHYLTDEYVTIEEFSDHTTDQDNPHNVTKAQVGLDKADNTSDMDKPISTATQEALDKKVDRVVTEDSGAKSTFDNSKGQHGCIMQSNFDDTIASFNTADENGEDGIVAQIYAKTKSTNDGVRLNVKKTGMYYSKGKSATTKPEEEISTKGDIKDKVDRVVTEDNGAKSTIDNQKGQHGAVMQSNFGDTISSFNTADENGEDGIVAQIYAKTKSTNEGVRLNVKKTGMYYSKGTSASTTDDEEIATKGDIKDKVDRVVTEDSGAKSIVDNSKGQHGVIMQSVFGDTKVSFNTNDDDGENGLLGQIYAKTMSTNKGMRFNVYKDGIFYNKDATTGSHDPQDEILTKRMLSGDFVIQKTDLSVAGEDKQIIQYVGETTAEYINGYFYRYSTTDSKWHNINVQDDTGGGGGGETKFKVVSELDTTTMLTDTLYQVEAKEGEVTTSEGVQADPVDMTPTFDKYVKFSDDIGTLEYKSDVRGIRVPDVFGTGHLMTIPVSFALKTNLSVFFVDGTDTDYDIKYDSTNYIFQHKDETEVPDGYNDYALDPLNAPMLPSGITVDVNASDNSVILKIDGEEEGMSLNSEKALKDGESTLTYLYSTEGTKIIRIYNKKICTSRSFNFPRLVVIGTTKAEGTPARFVCKPADGSGIITTFANDFGYGQSIPTDLAEGRLFFLTKDVGDNKSGFYAKIDGGVKSLTGEASVSFANIQGEATDNTSLNTALNAKQNKLTAGNHITIDTDSKISADDAFEIVDEIPTKASEVPTDKFLIKKAELGEIDYTLGTQTQSEITSATYDKFYKFSENTSFIEELFAVDNSNYASEGSVIPIPALALADYAYMSSYLEEVSETDDYDIKLDYTNKVFALKGEDLPPEGSFYYASEEGVASNRIASGDLDNNKYILKRNGAVSKEIALNEDSTYVSDFFYIQRCLKPTNNEAYLICYTPRMKATGLTNAPCSVRVAKVSPESYTQTIGAVNINDEIKKVKLDNYSVYESVPYELNNGELAVIKSTTGVKLYVNAGNEVTPVISPASADTIEVEREFTATAGKSATESRSNIDTIPNLDGYEFSHIQHMYMYSYSTDDPYGHFDTRIGMINIDTAYSSYYAVHCRPIADEYAGQTVQVRTKLIYRAK